MKRKKAKKRVAKSPKPEVIKSINGFTTEANGSLVAYYKEGWYYGYIEEVKPKTGTIIIRPIGKGHNITLDGNDVRAIPIKG